MLPYMTNYYGNPHSRTHSYGWESEKAVEQAREVFHCNVNVYLFLLNLSSKIYIASCKANKC